MKELFTSFLNSLRNPDWLKKQRFNLGKAWSYFALFVFAFSIVVAVPVSLTVRPAFEKVKKEFVAAVPDFEAKLDNGSLSVQKLKEPFVYRSKEEDFVVVVDTRSNGSSLITDYVSSTPNASVLINSAEIILNDNTGGQSRTQKWPTGYSESVSKQDIVKVFEQVLEPWFYFIILLTIFVGLYIGYFISKLYSILVVTLIVYISTRLSGRGYSMRELFTMGLYATTLPSIIAVLVSLTGLNLSYIHFIALLAFMLAVVYTDTKKKRVKIQ